MINLINPIINLRYILNLFGTSKKYRYLIITLARRDIADRYTRNIFGIIWAFFHPLMLIGMYIFIFGFVFRSKVGGQPPSDIPIDYTLYLLSGLIPWITFSDTLSRSCYQIIDNVNLVKQVRFPIEILPIKLVLATVFTQLILFSGFLSYMIVKGQYLYWTMLPLFILLILLQGLAMVGVSYFLSALTVFIRDTKDVVQVFVTIGIFATPILFQIEAIPEKFRILFYLNPLTYMTSCYRDVFTYQSIMHPIAWLIFPLFSIITLVFGYRFFTKFKLMFSSAL